MSLPNKQCIVPGTAAAAHDFGLIDRLHVRLGSWPAFPWGAAMGNVRHVVLVALAVILATALGRAGHAAEMRFALVIGNDEYKSAKLATPANDAGLIANALQAAGFTVTGARNLDQATLREIVSRICRSARGRRA